MSFTGWVTTVDCSHLIFELDIPQIEMIYQHDPILLIVPLQFHTKRRNSSYGERLSGIQLSLLSGMYSLLCAYTSAFYQKHLLIIQSKSLVIEIMLIKSITGQFWTTHLSNCSSVCRVCPFVLLVVRLSLYKSNSAHYFSQIFAST